METIYLDYNATTPVDPRVMARMQPYFTEHFGNASSGHTMGWRASEAVTMAREQVGALMGAPPDTLTFTSGATEALNHALKGVMRAYRTKGRHLVTVATEHKAVLDTCKTLAREGVEVTTLPVARDGRLDPSVFADALRDDTVLAVVMWANNETGVLQDIPALAAAAHDRGVLFCTDATQALGKVPVDVDAVDLLAGSAHKLYGPKGVGVLYAQPRLRFPALIDGGGQQDGHRGGTLNTPGIVGFGAAAALAREALDEEAQRLKALRDRLGAALVEALPGAFINGADAPRLPNTVSCTVPGLRADQIVRELRGVACATGSACSTADPRPSHVLTAMGHAPDEARATVRLSLGRPTTADAIDRAIDYLTERLRAAASAPAT
ncbi:cysteine desulfurase family protein [Salisaeta longa]|uniref:cysteine desulfurase family protein n=1 Tax=Salisaeta longa TaxID=503170 RepID=UPI0003B6CA3F|nr:cysteine desulfurase family protein [Salisaeta longa]